MFLSVEWAKRWLPATFLLLSMVLPWSTVSFYSMYIFQEGGEWVINRSFLWADGTFRNVGAGKYFWSYSVLVSQLPYLCFVSALILVGGLCGLLSKSRTRKLGGLFGILGVVSYFILTFPNSGVYDTIFWYGGLNIPVKPWHVNPYFGMSYNETLGYSLGAIWFLSIGFYLALAGSLILLSPIIRTGIERIRKRPSS